MSSLLRLLPFVWKQRTRFIASFVLGGGIALLWTGALFLVFPVVQILLLEQSPDDYVLKKLQAARESVVLFSGERDDIDQQLAELKRSGTVEGKSRLEGRRLICLRHLEESLRREWQFSWFATHVLPYLNKDRFTLLASVMFILLVLTAIKCCASYVQETLVNASVERTMQLLRERLFRSTLKLDYQTLTLETTPQLMSRFTYDLQQLAIGLTLLGSKAVIEPMKAATCIVGAFWVNWRLTALSFVCAPLAAILFGQLGRKLKQASRRQMQSMSRVYRALSETFQSIPVVLAYRNERLHRRMLAQENRDYYDKAMKIVRIDALSGPSIEFLAMLGVFVASLPGAYLVLRQETQIWGIQLASHEIDEAQLALLYTLLAGILDPARRIVSIFSKVKKSSAACERVFDWMDRSSLLEGGRPTVPLPRHHGSIEFDHVTFRYAAANEQSLRPPALCNVTLTIPFGSTVAVVGGNGCGKSTLVNLLPRLFDPQEGTVRIDGVDLSRADPRELRRQIGVVTQDTLLFDQSIEDNIRYGQPTATFAEVEDAARRAHVMSFVEQMPDGLKTGVGTRGQRLSGGQRQRVALARVILRDPAILILDEATSAVDIQSEKLIHSTLGELACNRTTLIVTHAMTPALLEHISHVLVMDEGQVVAFGPHQQVLETCPLYQKLFDAQIRRRAA